jgi:hypothetical protein
MQRMVNFESTIERDYAYVLDFESEVTSFSEQPLTIEYADAGRVRRYTPDFEVVRTDQRYWLVECKPQQLIHTDDNQRKFAAAQAWCAERSWQFEVVTDTQLRAGYRLQNIQFLTYHARFTFSAQNKSQVQAILVANPEGMTVGDVAGCLTGPDGAPSLALIWHMAFHHEVLLPLAVAPLSAQSAIRLPASRSQGFPAGEA